MVLLATQTLRERGGGGEIQGERGREKKASFSTKFFLPYVDMAQRERARARDKKEKQNKKTKLKKK